MKKFFILLTAGLFFFSCANNSSSSKEDSDEEVSAKKAKAEADDDVEAKLVKEYVRIGYLFYHLYDNKTAMVVHDNCYRYSLSEEPEIPATVKYESRKYKVTRIGDYAFAECPNLRVVRIPNSVKSIGDYAFAESDRLSYVSIPKSVKRIGYDPFGGCKNVEIDYEGDNYAIYVDLPTDLNILKEKDDKEIHFRDVIISQIDAAGVVTLIWEDNDYERHHQVVDPDSMQDLLVNALMEKCDENRIRYGHENKYYLIIEKDDAINTTDSVFQTVAKQYVTAVNTLRDNQARIRYNKKYAALNEEQKRNIYYNYPKHILGWGIVTPPPAPEVVAVEELVVVEDEVETEAAIISVEDDDEWAYAEPAVAEEDEEDEEDVIYQIVETMPEFPGGSQAMFNFLSENIHYPAIAAENGIQGKVQCQFVVNKDGSIEDVQVVRSAGEPSLDKEAIRLLKSMPKWNPGKQRGKPVRVKYTIPVNFKLE